MMKRYLLSLIVLCLLCVSAQAANRFAVCTATCTWDASSTAMWSTTTGGGTGASVPGTGDSVVLDAATCVGGVTCTITVNTSFTIQTLTMGACTAATTGCILDFSVNNNSPTFNTNGVNISGSGTRTLKMGSGTFTITGTSGLWNATTVTNLTLTQGTSTIAFSGNTATPRQFIGGGKTYATVSIGANTSAGAFQFTDSGNTYTTLNISAPNWVTFTFSSTTTVTNAIAWTGTLTKQILVSSDSNGLGATINSAANAAIQYAGIYRLTFGGGGTHAATNSFNFHNNSGITITAPASLGASSACILGGWLLWRDMPEHLNDNFPAWLEKAA